jgi:KTSC domain
MTWVDTPESGTISRLGYDDASRILTVEYKHGGIYNYFEVPQHVFDQMIASGSKGQFLTQQIKGVYRYARA